MGALLVSLVGFEGGAFGAVVSLVLGRFEGGDLGMQFVGLRVGVEQTGTAVGQPWIDGWLVGEGVGSTVGMTVGWYVGSAVGSYVGP